jgi:hypothetical protein
MNNGYVWHRKNEKIGTPDSIHHVLAYGDLDDARRLISSIGRAKLRRQFIEHPKKLYTLSSLNFIKNYLLGITEDVKDDAYLKNTPRDFKRPPARPTR